jgi:hypothetical protein
MCECFLDRWIASIDKAFGAHPTGLPLRTPVDALDADQRSDGLRCPQDSQRKTRRNRASDQREGKHIRQAEFSVGLELRSDLVERLDDRIFSDVFAPLSAGNQKADTVRIHSSNSAGFQRAVSPSSTRASGSCQQVH